MPNMTQKENMIRTIKRDNPEWVPYRYDGSLTSLAPAVIPRAMEGGLDDWGIQNSLFIGPPQWREFIKPRMKELYGVVKEYEGFVFQHSCGHLKEIMPDLIEIGLDVLDPCQPGANDIFSWKEQYGDRLSFMGGLDTQTYLSFGTPQEVKQAVKKVISVMADEGGYIAAPSHTINIPKENKQAMVEAIKEWNDSIGGQR